MKANHGTSNVPEELKPLYHELQELDKQVEAINQQRDSILAVITLLEPKYRQEPQPQIPEFLLKTETTTENMDTSLAGIDINFSAANRLVEKFFLICEVAHAAGKLVNTGGLRPVPTGPPTVRGTTQESKREPQQHDFPAFGLLRVGPSRNIQVQPKRFRGSGRAGQSRTRI